MPNQITTKPMRSQAQWGFLFANDMPFARRWAHETPGGPKKRFRKLPVKVRRKVEKDPYPDQTQFAGYTMEDWDDTKPDSFYHATKAPNYGASAGRL